MWHKKQIIMFFFLPQNFRKRSVNFQQKEHHFNFFFVAKKKHVQNLQEIMQQLKWESKILTESKTAFSWCEFVCILKGSVIDPDSLVDV